LGGLQPPPPPPGSYAYSGDWALAVPAQLLQSHLSTTATLRTKESKLCAGYYVPTIIFWYRVAGITVHQWNWRNHFRWGFIGPLDELWSHWSQERGNKKQVQNTVTKQLSPKGIAAADRILFLSSSVWSKMTIIFIPQNDWILMK